MDVTPDVDLQVDLVPTRPNTPTDGDDGGFAHTALLRRLEYMAPEQIRSLVRIPSRYFRMFHLPRY
jgi:hypothetical protein